MYQVYPLCHKDQDSINKIIIYNILKNINITKNYS